MCGIAGIIATDALTDDDHLAVEPMLDALHHRGPDGRGRWSDRHAVLGHTRLAIIDPDGGQQPIANEDQSVQCVVNGEIYNHVELRRELEARGHHFRTQSDSETVVHLYEEMGPTCVERLRGIFALAVWDSARRSLLLARDPLGVKPLYYARVGRRLYFASQLNALLTTGAIERTVDTESLHNYLAYHYVPSPKTILRNVSKLAPAGRLILTDQSMRTETYWDISFQANDARTDHEWLHMIPESLIDAVRANLVSDVPVGAFLSGGLDSSAVVATMSTLAPQRVRTYTMGFDQEAFDEREGARQLAARFDSDHRDQCVAPDARDIVDILARAFDEPFADPSAVPSYYVSRLAARHVKVVLSGDGGDELFAGYSRYARHHRERFARRLASSPTTRLAIRTVANKLGRRLRNVADNFTTAHDRAHYLSVAWFAPTETRALLAPDLARALAHHDPFTVLEQHFRQCDSQDPLARSQYVDMKTWLADGVLCKTDRAAMTNSLEARVPLLDAALAKMAVTLPTRLKIRGHVGKVAFRRAMGPIVGQDIAYRAKRGFEVPLDAWFRGPLRSLAHDALHAPDTRVTEWITPTAIEDAWCQLARNRRGAGARLWAILMLEMWARQNLRAPSRRASPAAKTGVLA